jgi:NADH-quinone oxidoreductase subunit J
LVHAGLVFVKAWPFVELTKPVPALGGWGADGVFLVLAAVTVLSAIAAVTLRSPVYCAVWFGMTLLGTAGLMLYQGAQFLGVATIVVYAGAILVTFLFVLMLAQPQGQAYYDRLSWEALLSACVGAVLVGVMTMTVATSLEQSGALAARGAGAAELAAGVLNDQHVARLGAELFSTHLVAVEIAGTLLLVALVGAAVVLARRESRDTAAGRTT